MRVNDYIKGFKSPHLHTLSLVRKGFFIAPCEKQVKPPSKDEGFLCYTILRYTPLTNPLYPPYDT